MATGDTAQPFLYLNSCAVVVENDARLVPNSLDGGSFDDDGAADTPMDGVWADVAASSIFVDAGFGGFLEGTDLGDGTYYIPFHVTPFNGTPITANGLLFSFELEFRKPGTYHLGFLEHNVISRTYYSDSLDGPDHFWSDISNNHDYNTIVVE